MKRDIIVSIQEHIPHGELHTIQTECQSQIKKSIQRLLRLGDEGTWLNYLTRFLQGHAPKITY